jgi:hypothetical protein
MARRYRYLRRDTSRRRRRLRRIDRMSRFGEASIHREGNGEDVARTCWEWRSYGDITESCAFDVDVGVDVAVVEVGECGAPTSPRSKLHPQGPTTSQAESLNQKVKLRLDPSSNG